MPMSYHHDSGGWVEQGGDYFYTSMKTRAFVPEETLAETDCGEGFDIEDIAALAAHYGVDITLTTKLGTIHIKSNTKFADD